MLNSSVRLSFQFLVLSIISAHFCFGCVARKMDGGIIRSESEKPDFAQRLKESPAYGNGPIDCAYPFFADHKPKTIGEDVFELRARFPVTNAFPVEEAPPNSVDRCAETYHSRPAVVLSAGDDDLRKIQLADNNEPKKERSELQALGIQGGAAAPGEVIIANFFHNKRFWFARIPFAKIKKAIFQLEHFPIVGKSIIDDLPKSIQRLLYSDGTSVTTPLGASVLKIGGIANRNLAGHTQVRLVFLADSPVVLYPQVRQEGNTESIKIHNIVLSSEALATPLTVYDPVSALFERFFIVNRITSIDEKYADMVIRQSHVVRQMEFSGEKALNKADLILKTYLQMSAENWKAMASEGLEKQKSAIYRTMSVLPDSALNCTSEVVKILESACDFNPTQQGGESDSKLVKRIFAGIALFVKDLDDKAAEAFQILNYPMTVAAYLQGEGFLPSGDFKLRENMDAVFLSDVGISTNGRDYDEVRELMDPVMQSIILPLDLDLEDMRARLKQENNCINNVTVRTKRSIQSTANPESREEKTAQDAARELCEAWRKRINKGAGILAKADSRLRTAIGND
jgi:hypothetical protein